MRGRILIAVLLFTASVFSQEKPQAEMVDDFEKVTCEDLSAGIDAFKIRLSNNPGTTGFVIFKRGEDLLSKLRWYKELLTSSFEASKISLDGLKVVMVESGDSVGGSFWLLPPGASQPISQYSEIENDKIDKTKPFIFGYEDELGICPTFVPRLYAELLREIPKSRGHLVVSGGTRDERRYFVRTWMETFTKDYQIPANRFRIFYTKGSSQGIAGGEFWFVPLKSK